MSALPVIPGFLFLDFTAAAHSGGRSPSLFFLLLKAIQPAKKSTPTIIINPIIGNIAYIFLVTRYWDSKALATFLIFFR
jgi:hypothetical protein